MAAKWPNYKVNKLHLKFMQILMLITVVNSGNIGGMERPIQRDIEEYLVKLNSTDELILNFKQYLEEVENVKQQLRKNKGYDKDAVLKLLESVDLSLVDDYDVGADGEEAQEEDDLEGAESGTITNGERHFPSYSKKNIKRSLYSSDEFGRNANAEELIKFKRDNKEIYDLQSHDNSYIDKYEEEFMKWSKRMAQNWYKPERRGVSAIFNRFQKNSVVGENSEMIKTSLNERLSDSKAIASAVSSISSSKGTKEIQKPKAFVAALRTVERHRRSSYQNIHDIKLDKIKRNLTALISDSSSNTNLLAAVVQSYLTQFDSQNFFLNGIESFYKPRDIVEMVFTIKKQIMDDRNFFQISESANVRKLLSLFPDCLQTLMISERVCLFNEEYRNYLYAPAGPVFFHDDETRYVFGWEGAGNPGRTDFVVEHLNGDEIRIKNRVYDEYLIASKIKYDKDRSFAMQWTAGIATDASIWKIVLGKDHCALLNTKHNEYLCMGDEKRDSDRRFTFTCPVSMKNVVRKSQFKFIDCDNK